MQISQRVLLRKLWVLVAELEGRGPLGKQRHKWKAISEKLNIRKSTAF
jgi:hypothetical protein